MGDRAGFDLPELDVEGEFQVVAIGECPEIEAGPGRVVTAVFSCSRGSVYNLHMEGEADPIRVTAGHPFRSAERGWVPAGELRPSERVLVAGGTAAVRGWERAGDEPVYNLEVEGDHCYRVGERGALVHNASSPCSNMNITTTGPAGAKYKTTPLFLEWPDGTERDYKLTQQAAALVMLQDDGDDASKAIKNLYKMQVRFIRPRPDGTPVPPAGTRNDWFGRDDGKDTAGHIIPKIAGGKITTDVTENGVPQNASRTSPHGEFTEWLRIKMKDMAQTDEVKQRLRDKGKVVPCSICVQWDFEYKDAKYPFRPSNIIAQVWLDGSFAMKWEDPN